MPATADAERLARLVSHELGLPLEARSGRDAGGDPWYVLRPVGATVNHAFEVRITMGWRRISIAFKPGRWAGELLAVMGNADPAGRAAFQAILSECVRRGAEIEFRVNDQASDAAENDTWNQQWSRLSLSLTSPTDPEVHGADPGVGAAFEWSPLFLAAIVALLPLESHEAEEGQAAGGFAEGASRVQRSIRYERDRRNRATAIALFGCQCQACALDFGDRYGEVARGFIEVHHTTPLSALEADTIIDPARDLVPLCPNCHAVAHRQDPPYSVEEIRAMLRRSHEEPNPEPRP